MVKETNLNSVQKASKRSLKTDIATVVEGENKITEPKINKPMVQPLQITENAIAMNGSNTLTPEQEADLLLKEAFAKAESKTIASQSIKPEQLLRETEWDIESERRNVLNDGLKSGLDILKNEAFALIGRKQ